MEMNRIYWLPEVVMMSYALLCINGINST